MTPDYEKDADGNYLLDADGNKKQISRGGIGMADGSVRDVYAMTQEQADEVLEECELYIGICGCEFSFPKEAPSPDLATPPI